jgi:valyl-tRNA synthetase
MLNMLDAQARSCQTGRADPGELLGLDRFEASKRVVELLEAKARSGRVEDRVIQRPTATARAW